MKKTLFSFLILNTLYLILVSPSFAQGSIISDVGKALTAQGNPFKYKDIGTLVSQGLALGLIAASLLVFLYLVWGGIQWITSGGDKAGVEAARNRITHAVFGATIVAATWAIFLIIKTFLGLPVTITGPGPATPGKVTPTPSAWSCTLFPCDCCNVYGTRSENAIKCCQQVGNLTPCVVARYKNNTNECLRELRIDWNCWRENYSRLGLDPNNDRCNNARFPQ